MELGSRAFVTVLIPRPPHLGLAGAMQIHGFTPLWHLKA